MGDGNMRKSQKDKNAGDSDHAVQTQCNRANFRLRQSRIEFCRDFSALGLRTVREDDSTPDWMIFASEEVSYWSAFPSVDRRWMCTPCRFWTDVHDI